MVGLVVGVAKEAIPYLLFEISTFARSLVKYEEQQTEMADQVRSTQS